MPRPKKKAVEKEVVLKDTEVKRDKPIIDLIKEHSRAMAKGASKGVVTRQVNHADGSQKIKYLETIGYKSAKGSDLGTKTYCRAVGKMADGREKIIVGKRPK